MIFTFLSHPRDSDSIQEATCYSRRRGETESGPGDSASYSIPVSGLAELDDECTQGKVPQLVAQPNVRLDRLRQTSYLRKLFLHFVSVLDRTLVSSLNRDHSRLLTTVFIDLMAPCYRGSRRTHSRIPSSPACARSVSLPASLEHLLRLTSSDGSVLYEPVIGRFGLFPLYILIGVEADIR